MRQNLLFAFFPVEAFRSKHLLFPSVFFFLCVVVKKALNYSAFKGDVMQLRSRRELLRVMWGCLLFAAIIMIYFQTHARPQNHPSEIHSDSFCESLLHERLQLQREVLRLRQLSSTVQPQSTTFPPSETKRPSSLPRKDAWLLVGIPTVPRKGEADTAVTSTLLYRTVKSYIDQLAQNEALSSAVTIAVVNNRPGAHPIFNAVRKTVEQLASDQYFEDAVAAVRFFDAVPIDLTAVPSGDNDIEDLHEKPTAAARKQTLDVVALLDTVRQLKSKYYLFTEDDFTLCQNGLMAIQYMIGKANLYLGRGKGERPFSAMRCGFGLNGIIMHNDPSNNDVRRFRDYLLRHNARRPPDHLVVEFFASETDEGRKHFGGRRPAAFRHNIFLHNGGKQSTIRVEEGWSTPQCFTDLIVPQVFEVEAWDPQKCRHDDIWPCDSPAAERHVSLSWNTSAAARVSEHVP